MGQPVVSVVIPCFNRAATLGPALESALAQGLAEIEVLLVDDGSADGAALDALVAARGDARVRVLRHPVNRGVSAARNTGIAAAAGRFVAFLDSDDLWLPAKLATQLEAALRSPDPDRVICLAKTRIVMPGGWERIRPLAWPQPDAPFARFLYGEGGFAQCSSFFLATALARKAPFNETLRQYEDHLFLIEAQCKGGQLVLLDQTLSVWMNDERPDRLSGHETEARIHAFAEQARASIAPALVDAILARTTCELVWKRSRLASLRLLMRAVSGGAMTLRQALILLARMIIPHERYQRWRKRLTAA